MILGKLRILSDQVWRHFERKWAIEAVENLTVKLLGEGATEHDVEVLVFARVNIIPDEWRAMDVFQRRDWLRAIRDQGKGTTPSEDLGKEELALAAIVAHPDWTDAKIARHVGCSRTSLYRWPRYVAAREALEMGRHDRPKASDL